MPLSTAAIVCAHSIERRSLLARSVRSVLEGDQHPDEMFVVVDNNEELLAALAGDLAGTGITLLANDGAGVGAARTTAVVRTGADVCAFIDDDAWAEPDWLRKIAEPFEAPEIAGAGGLVLPEWGEGASTLPAELWWVVGSTYRGHRDSPGPISRPIGANMAGRTAVIREIGGFPSGFGSRGATRSSSNEELALYSLITRRHGADSVVFVPGAVVHHYAPAARTTWRYLLRRSWIEGKSKADVRRTFGRSVMSHDGRYVRSTLLPAIARYAAAGTREPSQLQEAARCSAALGVTAAGYAARLAATRGAPVST